MSLADDTDDPRGSVRRVVDVWACNMDAVEVFQLCPVGGIGHMGGVHWTGIDPYAIRSACILLRKPRHRWDSLGVDVAYMGMCVATHRNREAAARARRQ